MNSVIKTGFWAIMTIIVIVLASLFIGVVLSTFFSPGYNVTTTQPNTITFTKISNTDIRVKEGNYFNLTQKDIGNYTGLIYTLNDLVNSSTNTQFTFSAKIQLFNSLKSLFLTKSHGLTVFAYENNFIEFKINVS